jgi:hypothetical protein
MREDFKRMVLETIDRKIVGLESKLMENEDKELVERKQALERLRKLLENAGSGQG